MRSNSAVAGRSLFAALAICGFAAAAWFSVRSFDAGRAKLPGMRPSFIDLWKYVPLNSSVPGLGAFIGADELHMTHAYCVGEYRINKTCLYRNIYYDGTRTAPRQNPNFLLFAAVKDVTDATPELASKLVADAKMSLISYNSPDSDWWDVKVVFFHRARHVGRVRLSRAHQAPKGAAQGGPMSSDGAAAWPPPPTPFAENETHPKPMVVPPLAQTAIADEWMVTSSAGRDGNTTGLAHACVLEQAAAGAAAMGMACLPAGVAATVSRPTFLVIRNVHYNIGHLLWDDFMPWFGAVFDLGLGGRHDDMQLFIFDHHGGPPESFDDEEHIHITLQIYPGLAHTYHPALFRRFQQHAQGRVIHLRTFMGGLLARGSHAVPSNYSVYGTPTRRLVWMFREHYVAGMGLKAMDNDWSRVQVKSPHVVILQKKDKRVITGLDDIIAHLQGVFPHAVFEVLYWEHMKGHRNEVIKLLQTHIVITADGTGADTLFLLPPGSVHISLGVTGPCAPTNIADFIFASMDHIRVLYFDGNTERSKDQAYKITFEAERLVPFVRYAVDLVQKRFEIPVPFLQNHSPNGQLCYRLFQQYPALAASVARMWVKAGINGLPCDLLREKPVEIYKTFVGEPPADLMDYVNGTKGYPPGPDINEVSRSAPLMCAPSQ